MRPEVRRTLAISALLAACLAGGALWVAIRSNPPAAATATPPLSASALPPTALPTLALVEPTALSAAPHALPSTPTPTALVLAPTATLPAATASPVAPEGSGAGTTANTTPAHFPLVIIPAPTGTPAPVNPPAAGSDWRVYLNYYRAVAHLPPLMENAAWSQGAFNHARYLVENDVNTPDEDPALAWYSAEGAAAGPESLWQLRGEANWNDVQTFDTWMRWPFHALSIIDPALASYGYGRYSEPGADPGPFHTGAVLDVRRGLTQPNVAYPVKWPDTNTAVYLTSYDGGEQPDPLTSCSGLGLNGPAGLPIILQVGPGDAISANTPRPVVTFSSFKENGQARDHCLFDETTYQNSIASLRDQGRALLAARDAIVLIPRAPLVAGRNYTVSITALGQTHTWTFRVVTKP